MKRIRSILILAVTFIVAGSVLTLENMGILSGAGRLWPVFVTIIGSGFLILFFDRMKKDLVLLWLGISLMQFSAFFFYLNFTSWNQMARLWPLFIGITGISFFAVYVANRMRFFLFLSIGLIMLGSLFYLVFGISLRFWPLSLVAFGISLVLVNNFYLKGK